MEVISSEFLKQLLSGSVVAGTTVSGIILVNDYNVLLTKNKKEYISGTLLSGTRIDFKAWGSSNAFSKLKLEEYISTPAYITGTLDNYNGNISITVDDIQAVSGYSKDLFLETRYNVDAYYTALLKLMNNNVSDNAIKIVNSVFTDDIISSFKTEFAATSHHDNCKGGLLAHTYKCLSLLTWTLNMYKPLYSIPSDEGLTLSQDRKDLLYLGVLFHDIGKLKEMNLGVYQNCAKVSHRYLGVEYLLPCKDLIIEVYGDEWWYDLVSILLQHHDEFGDPCTTLVSYIVSRVDLYESRMTLLQQLMSEKLVSGSSGSKIYYDGRYLTV